MAWPRLFPTIAGIFAVRGDRRDCSQQSPAFLPSVAIAATVPDIGPAFPPFMAVDAALPE
jgi:hypothetical protein